MIKSARVMKKAVAYLVPFMEKEREENEAKLSAKGITITEEVQWLYKHKVLLGWVNKLLLLLIT